MTAAGCWEWSLSRNSSGYGLCWRSDWRGLAHRFSYQAFKGDIGEGREIDHMCRNIICVNPDHLEAVSRSDNIVRRHRAVLGRNYALYQNSRGLWVASIQLSTKPRRRKNFTALEKSVAAAKAEAWIAAREA